MTAAGSPHLSSLTALLFVIAAVAVAAVTVRRPAAGVAVLFGTIPFAFERYVGPTTISLPKVALLAVIAGLMIRRVPLAPLTAPRARALLAGALAILVVSAICSVPAEYHGAALRETLKAAEYVGFLCVAYLGLIADDDPRAIGIALDVVTVAVCLSALREFGGGSQSAIMVGTQAVPRIAGLLEGPNQLSGYLDVVVPLLVARTFSGERARTAAAIATIAGIALVLTLSRAGIATGLVGLVVVALRFARTRRAFVAILGSAVLIAAAAVLALVRRGGFHRLAVLSESDTLNGLATRSELWQAAIALWRSHPILGVGPANYELELPTVGLLGVRTHANNLYLEALADGGILLFAAVAWTAVASIITFARYAGRDWLAVGALGASVALVLHQTVDDLVFYPKVGDAWWMVLGFGLARIAAVAHRNGALYKGATP